MLLKNDINSLNILDDVINDFYEQNGNRYIRNFQRTENIEWGWIYLHYLLDRKYVIRYGIGQDRSFWVGGLELAIGPNFFGPGDFWSYENLERFTMEASTEGVIHNLKLFDEFLQKTSA